MLKFLLAALVIGLAMGAFAQPGDEKAARMKWWKEARFGLFIHWGLYAIPAGKWGDRDTHGEWIRTTAQIPLETYNQLQPQFNPTKFDANEWMTYAQDAGMKYVVITTKHHDGFGLWDSKLTDWDVMGSPYKRDIMKEIAEAARAKGLVPSWYHSIMDWHHPDYLPHREWEKGRPSGNFDKFDEYLRGQVSELLTKYGPIGVMWFDGEWESTWNHERGQRLYDLCRKLQPSVIVNNRVDVGRDGMAGMTKGMFAGDFGTPEQEVPAEGIPGAYWESCITMNSHWGWNAADRRWKSTEELIKLLIEIVSKGGNFLLNVGPKADGTFPTEAIDRLKGIGAWMKVSGDAIYGTDASPFSAQKGWKSTRKGNSIYVFVEDSATEIRVPGVGSDPTAVTMMSGAKVEWKRDSSDLVLALPKSDGPVPVARLDFSAFPPIYRDPVLVAESDSFVNQLTIQVEPKIEGVDWRMSIDGSEPTAKSPKVASWVTISGDTTVAVRGFVGEKPVTALVKRAFKRVIPSPAMTPEGEGFKVQVIPGSFAKCDDMIAGAVGSSESKSSLTLGDFEKRENVGLIYEGYVTVEKTEMYKFSLTSDDGSRLFVDGKLVVDNDGLHSPVEKFGSMGLAKGSHRIRVEWFNATGGAALMVGYSPLGGEWKKL